LTGLVLIDHSQIVIGNARFQQLGKISHKPGKWIVCGNGRPLRPETATSTLADVVLELAGRMLLRRPVAAIQVRYKSERSDRVFDVRLERGPPWAANGGLVLALVEDATRSVETAKELARTRRALARSETLRAVGEIASGVVHDLANLLAAMQMRTALMERDSALSPAQRERLDGLNHVLCEGSSVLSRLKDFSRAGRGQRSAPVDLVSIIRDAVEMTCASVTEKAALAGTRVSIILRLGVLPPVYGVASELRQMFINLVLNARDAMPRGGDIEITSRVTRGQVVITVEDQGCGVPPELQERIFEPFFTTKGRNGTGLGLSMARDLMKRLGGRISVGDRRPQGAVFTLKFPVAAAATR